MSNTDNEGPVDFTWHINEADILEISLVGLPDYRCHSVIQLWARQLKTHHLADAEYIAAHTTFDFGGDYRDLKHLLLTETRAALLAVERRHFEESFTSC